LFRSNVTIGNRVKSIGYGAFYYCASLMSVTFPNSVSSIGESAFDHCFSLTAVYFQGNAPAPNNDSTVFFFDPATVFYLPGTSGWGSGFDNRPTALWYLPTPLILTGANGNNNF